MQAFDSLLGVRPEALTFGQMALRAVIVFVIALVLIRLGDKRFLGRQTAFDWVLGIILGAVLSRAINGSAPFFPTLGAAGVLLLLHWLFAAIAFRSHAFSRAIKGQHSVLVRAGAIQWSEMRRNHITEGDLLEDLRYEAHVDSVDQVETATLECNGRMSVIKRTPDRETV